MEQWISHLCADAGGEYCPCYLAEIKRCVNCGLLSGQKTCECEWTGSCIYSEFNWNTTQSRPPRVTVPVDVESSTCIGAGCWILSLRFPAWMARELRAPGAFVFLRPMDSPSYFEAPLSIMQVQSTLVHIAVQVLGPKTHVLTAPVGRLAARGPFHSGIIGLASMKVPSHKALVIGKGISQGRAVHTANYLAKRGVTTTLALGPGPVGKIFGATWLDTGPVTVTHLDRKSDHNRGDLMNLLCSQDWDLVVSAGPDVQHRMIHEEATRLRPGLRLSFTNNALMCCGEGICGACGSLTTDHQARSCKATPETGELLFLR